MGRRATAAYTSILTLAAAFCVGVGLAPSAAHAWTEKTQKLIAEHAMSIAPPDLRRQIDRNLAAYRDGAEAPGGISRTCGQESRPEAELEQRVQAETQRAIEAIRAHRPFRDIVYRLGVLSHYVADVNNPLCAADTDPREGQYFNDYLRYVERAQERYSLVFYGEGRELSGAEGVTPLLDRTLARGRRLYPTIGREYRRVGGPPGTEKFDDRSVAFAVGSLALSHAVSDVGAVLRYVWLEAGGGDTRQLPLSGGSEQ